MKIIGRSKTGVLVEMSDDEVAVCAGYGHTYDHFHDQPHLFKDRNSHGGYLVGVEMDVRAAFGWISRLKTTERQARDCAGIMRHMADMITGALPSAFLEPEPEFAEVDEKVTKSGDKS